ncbi:MAG: metallophosphoesterase, partial [Eubacterium sp.]|nr:metallophosphoesterase [Eubacterium sp.]
MKKVLKTTGKVIGIVIASILGFLALLCIITLIWGGVQRGTGTKTESLPVVAEDFKPTIRLILMTDTHNENENVANAIDAAYKLFDNDKTYKGIDAFYCLGDFSSVGGKDDYINYNNAVKEHVRKETPFITIHGNHELKDANYKQYFDEVFGYEPDNVKEINGFSCIAFSGERSLTEWTFTPKSLKWLSDSVKEAEAKADGKPVFVFTHPHPFGTVYGSSVWCDPQLNVIFNGKTNLIDFSGHSHFPFNDP